MDSDGCRPKARSWTDSRRSSRPTLGVAHGVSAANGTVALHLAFAALGIGPGDEVIVPTLTYVASVNAITYTGAKPVSWTLIPLAGTSTPA